MPDWTLDVTLDDIAAARDDWERAKARGDDPRRIADLWRDVEVMCRAHVWQLVEAMRPRSAGPRLQAPEAGPPDPS